MQDLWGSFPRLLEQNINGLLDHAEPNPVKAFQLYKACKNEDVWRENFDSFSKVLAAFYAKPRGTRRKSAIDQLLDRPMPSDVFQNFHLTFRTAAIEEKQISDLASWAHNLIRVSRKTINAVIGLDVMTATLKSVVNPGPLDKEENIDFDDFCGAWKKTVKTKFGDQHAEEFTQLVNELQKLNDDHHDLEEVSGLIRLPLLQITDVELEWIKLVRLSALAQSKIPKPPPQYGQRKQALRDLDRVIQLYEIVLETKIGELTKHRQSTRFTLIDRCNTLIAEATPIAA